MFIGADQEKTAVTARSFVIWGEELSKKGRYAAAEKLYQRALGLVERTLGQQHPLTAEVLECYAELLAKTNRRVEGIAMKTRSEEGSRSSLFLSHSHPGPPIPKRLGRTRRFGLTTGNRTTVA